MDIKRFASGSMAVILAAVGLLPAGASQRPPHTPLAIANVNVVPIDRPQVLPALTSGPRSSTQSTGGCGSCPNCRPGLSWAGRTGWAR